jgi:hypothetical protein
VDVPGIGVHSSRNSQSLRWEPEDVSTRLRRRPSYAVSDSAGVMNKGIGDFGAAHIRDVSHTPGMFMERVYKNCEAFSACMKEMSQVRFREVMNSAAYLLPAKQRTVARFMNLSKVVERSGKILENFTKLTDPERKTLAFVPRHASMISELRTVMTCVHSIEHEVKHGGLSKKT